MSDEERAAFMDACRRVMDACRRVWGTIQRIIAETLDAITRWWKRHRVTLYRAARACGYRPETMTRRNIRRAFGVVRR